MTDDMAKSFGAEFELNGSYFKKEFGETYILENCVWVRYYKVFQHKDVIACNWLI